MDEHVRLTYPAMVAVYGNAYILRWRKAGENSRQHDAQQGALQDGDRSARVSVLNQ